MAYFAGNTGPFRTFVLPSRCRSAAREAGLSLQPRNWVLDEFTQCATLPTLNSRSKSPDQVRAVAAQEFCCCSRFRQTGHSKARRFPDHKAPNPNHPFAACYKDQKGADTPTIGPRDRNERERPIQANPKKGYYFFLPLTDER